MQTRPDDLNGWLLLGRSDIALERVDGAVAAYERAHRLDANNVEALLGLGEALSMRAGGDITPDAGDLFEHAVSLEPDNPKALLYCGFGAATRGDRATAESAGWRSRPCIRRPKSMPCWINASPSSAPPIWGLRARNLARPTWQRAVPGTAQAATPAASDSAAQATVNLSIAPALKGRLTPDAALFIFAQEPGMRGPPLAAKRLTSAAIGTQIQLSSADSMIPGRVLTAGRKVSITARVSFSGQPLPGPGRSVRRTYL